MLASYARAPLKMSKHVADYFNDWVIFTKGNYMVGLDSHTVNSMRGYGT